MNIFQKFKKYLTDSNLIVTVLVTVISTFSYDLVSSLINDIIFPLVEHADDDERGNLNDYIVNLKGKKIKTGLFLRSLIKFLLLFVIILVFLGFIND